MPKQPFESFSLEWAPVSFPEDFPFSPVGDCCRCTLPEGEVTGLHMHDCFELGYCVEGAGIFIVDHKVLPFAAGDVSVIFANQYHKAQSERGKTSRWEFVEIDAGKLLSGILGGGTEIAAAAAAGDERFDNLLPPERCPEITRLTRLIFDELEGGRPGYRPLAKAYLWALLCLLGREMTAVGAPKPVRAPAGRALGRIAPAVEYIARSYMEPIIIGELAARCSMSVTNFRRVFTRVAGRTPYAYLEQVRIQMASVLLSGTELSVLEISLRTGFDSLSGFNRRFRELKGVTPREWRVSSGAAGMTRP